MMMSPATMSCSVFSLRTQTSSIGSPLIASPSPRDRATQAVECQHHAEHDGRQSQHQRTGVADVEKFEPDPEAIDIERVRRVARTALRRDVDDVEEAQEID